MAHSSRAWENNWVAHHELQWFVLFCLISWTISNTLTCVFTWIGMLSHISHWQKTYSIYISFVFVPFHKFAQAFSLIGFPVNSRSALGLAPGSPIIHIWMEICALFPTSIVLREKNLMGNHLKPEEDIFCAPLMQFRRCTVQVSIGNRKGPNEKQFGKTQYHRNKGLEVMSRTGSYLDIRPVRVNYYWILSSQIPKY